MMNWTQWMTSRGLNVALAVAYIFPLGMPDASAFAVRAMRPAGMNPAVFALAQTFQDQTAIGRTHERLKNLDAPAIFTLDINRFAQAGSENIAAVIAIQTFASNPNVFFKLTNGDRVLSPEEAWVFMQDIAATMGDESARWLGETLSQDKFVGETDTTGDDSSTDESDGGAHRITEPEFNDSELGELAQAALQAGAQDLTIAEEELAIQTMDSRVNSELDAGFSLPQSILEIISEIVAALGSSELNVQLVRGALLRTKSTDREARAFTLNGQATLVLPEGASLDDIIDILGHEGAQLVGASHQLAVVVEAVLGNGPIVLGLDGYSRRVPQRLIDDVDALAQDAKALDQFIARYGDVRAKIINQFEDQPEISAYLLTIADTLQAQALSHQLRLDVEALKTNDIASRSAITSIFASMRDKLKAEDADVNNVLIDGVSSLSMRLFKDGIDTNELLDVMRNLVATQGAEQLTAEMIFDQYYVNRVATNIKPLSQLGIAAANVIPQLNQIRNGLGSQPQLAEALFEEINVITASVSYAHAASNQFQGQVPYAIQAQYEAYIERERTLYSPIQSSGGAQAASIAELTEGILVDQFNSAVNDATEDILSAGSKLRFNAQPMRLMTEQPAVFMALINYQIEIGNLARAHALILLRQQLEDYANWRAYVDEASEKLKADFESVVQEATEFREQVEGVSADGQLAILQDTLDEVLEAAERYESASQYEAGDAALVALHEEAINYLVQTDLFLTRYPFSPFDVLMAGYHSAIDWYNDIPRQYQSVVKANHYLFPKKVELGRDITQAEVERYRFYSRVIYAFHFIEQELLSGRLGAKEARSLFGKVYPEALIAAGKRKLENVRDYQDENGRALFTVQEVALINEMIAAEETYEFINLSTELSSAETRASAVETVTRQIALFEQRRGGNIAANMTDAEIVKGIELQTKQGGSTISEFRSAYDAVEIAGDQAAAQYGNAIAQYIDSLGVSDEDARRYKQQVLDRLAKPKDRFGMVRSIVATVARYFLGNQAFLALDFVDWLLQRGEYLAVQEYMIHEALEIIPDDVLSPGNPEFAHRTIIAVTQYIVHGEDFDIENSVPGQTPLGILAREFIDQKAATADAYQSNVPYVFQDHFGADAVADLEDLYGQRNALRENLGNDNWNTINEENAAYDRAKKAGRDLPALSQEAQTLRTLDGAIQAVLDQANLIDVRDASVVVDELEAAQVHYVDDVDASDLQPYRDQVDQDLMNGHISMELFFAGAASRLNDAVADAGGTKQPMYFTDIAEVALLFEQGLEDHVIEGVPMGPRQLIMLALKVYREGERIEPNGGGARALANFKPVIHVNGDIQTDVEQDLLRNNFYGFNPANVILINQPTLRGFEPSGTGSFDMVADSNTYPWNHGYATMQLGWAGEGYRLNQRGERVYLNGSVVDYLDEQGVSSLVAGRINDMDRYGEDYVLDLDMLAHSERLFEEDGANITLDTVENTTGQKGGLGLSRSGSKDAFLMEGVNAKSDAIDDRLGELNEQSAGTGVAYSAFRNTYKIRGGAMAAMLSEGLPMTVRMRDGLLYPEVPTGDIAMVEGAHARVVSRRGKLINDFKQPSNLDVGTQMLADQDRDADFASAAQEWLENYANTQTARRYQQNVPFVFANHFTGEQINQLGELFALRDEDNAKEVDALIQEILDNANLITVRDGLDIDTLEAAPVEYLDEEAPELEPYLEAVDQQLINGQIGMELFFAGAASRLNEQVVNAGGVSTPMYFTDIAGIARLFGDEMPEGVLEGIPMGPRQLMQLALKVYREGERIEPNGGGDRALANFKPVIHVNGDIQENVETDLIRNNFYGFNPANVIIVNQPTLNGFTVDQDGQFQAVDDSKPYPWNHGYATMQLGWAGQGYRLTANGREYLSGSVVDFLESSGVETLSAGRINDMDRYGEQYVLDLPMLAHSRRLFDEQGANISMDMVENTTGQKGGLALRREGSQGAFLLEGVNAQDKAIDAKLKELNEEAEGSGIPYSAFRNVYDLREGAFAGLLAQGLPMTVRYRGDGHLYPEVPTGDIAMVEGAQAVAVSRPGKLINDFKKPTNMEAGLNAYAQQDADPDFAAWAQQWKARAEQARINDALENDRSQIFQERDITDDPASEVARELGFDGTITVSSGAWNGVQLVPAEDGLNEATVAAMTHSNAMAAFAASPYAGNLYRWQSPVELDRGKYNSEQEYQAALMKAATSEYSKKIDGSAVAALKKLLKDLAEKLGITIIVAGNEGGIRDASASLTVGERFGSRGDVYLWIGDAVDNTNAIKQGEARLGAMAMGMLVKLQDDTYTQILTPDTYFASVVFPVPIEVFGENAQAILNGIDPVITQENTLRDVLQPLADALGVPIESLNERFDLLFLERPKRHQEILDMAEELNFTVLMELDGDPTRAIAGVTSETGRLPILLGVGGANEHNLALHASASVGNAAVARMASNAGLGSNTGGTMAGATVWEESGRAVKDVEQFADLNQTAAELRAQGYSVQDIPTTSEALNALKWTSLDVPAVSTVTVSAITGARGFDAGILQNVMGPVRIQVNEDGSGSARATVMVIRNGLPHFLEMNYGSSDIIGAVWNLLAANIDTGNIQGEGGTFPVKMILSQVASERIYRENRDDPEAVFAYAQTMRDQLNTLEVEDGFAVELTRAIESFEIVSAAIEFADEQTEVLNQAYATAIKLLQNTVEAFEPVVRRSILGTPVVQGDKGEAIPIIQGVMDFSDDFSRVARANASFQAGIPMNGVAAVVIKALNAVDSNSPLLEAFDDGTSGLYDRVISELIRLLQQMIDRIRAPRVAVVDVPVAQQGQLAVTGAFAQAAEAMVTEGAREVVLADAAEDVPLDDFPWDELPELGEFGDEMVAMSERMNDAVQSYMATGSAA